VRLGKGVNILKLNSSVKDLSSYKLNILSFRKSKITKALYELKQKYNDILTFSHSHSRLIEVNLNNTNKGEGVHFVANELNITQKEIAVIGDSNNDLPAFLMSSLKIAVKTKSKLLKQHASYYLNYKRNAVADAINKYILPLRDIKLIASDLDGTLLRNKTKEIDDRAKQLIKKVVDQFDKKFVICTGRSIDDTLVVVDYFHFKNIKNVFLICVNGGCIYDVANQKYLFESTMQKTSVEKILTIFKNFQDDKTRLKEIAIEAFIDYDEQSLIKRTPQTHYLINKDYIYNFYTTKHPGMLKNF
jgi:hydroxymethylpyrimidine pyrophosphatase-like HAD family hydrolase